MKKTYQLERLSCPTCASKIEKMLTRTEGIIDAEVMFISSKVKLEFDENIITNEDIKNKIGKFGYSVIGEK